jgi:hypothetical protein
MHGFTDFLGIYAIWGKGGFARWMRSTAMEFLKVGIEFMICFWLWTLSPWVMTFAIPGLYIAWLWGWKAYREAKYERNEVVRRRKALADVTAKLEGDY